MALEDLQEGVSVHDGVRTVIYDPNDQASIEALFFQKCIDWGIGPLKISGCVSTDPLSMSVTATLAGIKFAECTLSESNPTCTVGFSVLGVKAEVTLTLEFSPLALNIKGEVSLPFDGSKSFDVTIPLG